MGGTNLRTSVATISLAMFMTLLLLSSGAAQAQYRVPCGPAGTNAAKRTCLSGAEFPVFSVNRFDTTAGDNQIDLINPTGNATGLLCAMIYVYDSHEEQFECCGCPVTSNGLRSISTVNDLTKNTAIGPTPPTTGIIKVLSSDPTDVSSSKFGFCNPAKVTTATLDPELKGFANHPQRVGTIAGISETSFRESQLTDIELNSLTTICNFIHRNGTGRGVCTCGTGDNFPAGPGAGVR